MKRSKHKEIHQERQRAPEEPSVLVMGTWYRETLEVMQKQNKQLGETELVPAPFPQPNHTNLSRDHILILHVHSIKDRKSVV